MNFIGNVNKNKTNLHVEYVCQKEDFKNEPALNIHMVRMHQDVYFRGHREIEL